VLGIAVAIRKTVRSREPAATLLAALSAPPILVFLQHAIGDRVEGNWPAIVYPAAAVAAAGLGGAPGQRWVWPSCGLGFAIAAGVYAHGMTGWPAVPGSRDPVARQLLGWGDLAARTETLRQAAHADFIAAEPYGAAAELAWALPEGVDVIGTGPRWSSTSLALAAPGDRQGVLIRPERYGGLLNPGEWHDVTRLPDIARTGENGEIERYAVFLVRLADPKLPSVLLPHR
jgi:hypothetical protein